MTTTKLSTAKVFVPLDADVSPGTLEQPEGQIESFEKAGTKGQKTWHTRECTYIWQMLKSDVELHYTSH